MRPTHTGGLFGAKAARRAGACDHRGRGKKCGGQFFENDMDVVD